MKHVVGVRKELGVRTIFNFLGPLTNPAGARRQLLGVSDRRSQETVAEALASLDCEHALVVAAEDGLDELTISGASRVIEVRDGGTEEWYLSADEVGLAEAPLEAIAGGSPEENAATTRSVLAGEPGPHRDIALLNAGAAIYVAGEAEDVPAGVARAAEAVDEGAPARTLEALIELTAELAQA
jgi:anthranilate phosphoribosyltransferase